MKRTFRRSCCLLLVISLLLQLAPAVQAQGCDVYGVLNGAYAELQEARAILCGGGGLWSMQSANLPLERAKRLVGSDPFARCYPGLASDLHRGIEKAKVQVLWNDAGDAVEIINRLMGKVERALGNPDAYARGPSRTGFGALFAAPVVAGLGALLFGWARGWNWGQVSTGGSGLNIRATLGHGNPVLVH